MESTQIQALYEPPPAAMQQLSEKPRHGFETRKTAGKPGSSSCNFTVALGLRATVVENGVRETYSARYYNPATGRFLSRDPLEGNIYDPKTLHKYLYADGDPVNGFDPTGRDDEIFSYVRQTAIAAVETLAYARRISSLSRCVFGLEILALKEIDQQVKWNLYGGAAVVSLLWGCVSAFNPSLPF